MAGLDFEEVVGVRGGVLVLEVLDEQLLLENELVLEPNLLLQVGQVGVLGSKLHPRFLSCSFLKLAQLFSKAHHVFLQNLQFSQVLFCQLLFELFFLLAIFFGFCFALRKPSRRRVAEFRERRTIPLLPLKSLPLLTLTTSRQSLGPRTSVR